MYGGNFIFASSFEIGEKKLKKIKKEKEQRGIKMEDGYKMTHTGQFYMRFYDSEEWLMIDVSKTKSRGHRWKRALVDSNINKEIVECYCEPYCVSGLPKLYIEFFDPEVE